MLRLIAENTPKELEDRRINKLPGRYHCRGCRHKWVEPLEDTIERGGTCPKCGK